MEGLKAPGERSFEGNVAENWRRWKRSFQNYLMAIDLVLLTPIGDNEACNAAIFRRQVAILFLTAGEEADEIYSQIEFTEDQTAHKLSDVVDKFETHCNPRQNILYEWFIFWSLSQGAGEPVDVFLKRLKTQAVKCEIGDLKERMMLFRILFGLSDPKLKERLLRDRHITLDRNVDDIQAAEMTRQQIIKIAEGVKQL